MKILFSLCILLGINVLLKGQEVPIPINYSIVDTVTGDLDKDNIAELVVAYNVAIVDDMTDVDRELIIYKQEADKWIEWKKSKQALYNSRGGGMMGDPFESIEIKKGILMISHYGGSSWKWGFTDKYRYQNGAFCLIGYTGQGGKLCEYWRQVDFNLSTGKMIVTKEYEDCDTDIDNPKVYKKENETHVERGVQVTLKDRQAKEIKITTPKYQHDIYIAIGKDEQ